MDRKHYGQLETLTCMGFNVTPQDLEDIRSAAIRVYVNEGNTDMAKAWIKAVDRFLEKSLREASRKGQE